jgi:hypothetical protein
VALGDALGDIEAGWDGLSDTLQGAIAREMGMPVPDAKDAASNELEVFRRMPTGAILSSWWGRETPHYLGILDARLARLEATLGDEDFESWQDWINKRLTAEEAAKILHEAVQ